MKRIRNLMSALLGRTDRHDVSAVSLPRVSRLTEAALIFLVAASGVFFVGAPAGFAKKAVPIQITQMTVSSDDVIVTYAHTTKIATNIDFAKVEWFINDDEEPSDTQDGPASSSVFERAYTGNDGFGGPRGKPVTITAKVTDADGHTASDSIVFNVWSSDSSIDIISKSPDDSRIVEDQQIKMSIETDVGFWYVEWSVDGKIVETTNGPATKSRFRHTFSKGLPNGKDVPIQATVYGINPFGALPTDSTTITMTVYDDNDYIWKEQTAWIVSVDPTGNPDEYELVTWHSAVYYNDMKGAVKSHLRRKSGWWEATKEVYEKNVGKKPLENFMDLDENFPIEMEFTPMRTYSSSVAGDLRYRKVLVPGNYYALHAYTNILLGDQDGTQANSSAVLYEKRSKNLPPTGDQQTDQNESEAAKFLFE